MITIAYTGVQGSGKSTAIRNLRDNLPGTVIVVEEVARSLNMKLDHKATVEIQEKIWHKHLVTEIKARNEKPDWIICDRTLMDNLCYMKHLCDSQKLPLDAFYRFLPITRNWMKMYDMVVRLPLNEDYILNDSDCIRSKNLEYARKIDKLFDEYVQSHVTVNL